MYSTVITQIKIIRMCNISLICGANKMDIQDVHLKAEIFQVGIDKKQIMLAKTGTGAYNFFTSNNQLYVESNLNTLGKVKLGTFTVENGVVINFQIENHTEGFNPILKEFKSEDWKKIPLAKHIELTLTNNMFNIAYDKIDISSYGRAKYSKLGSMDMWVKNEVHFRPATSVTPVKIGEFKIQNEKIFFQINDNLEKGFSVINNFTEHHITYAPKKTYQSKNNTNNTAKEIRLNSDMFDFNGSTVKIKPSKDKLTNPIGKLSIEGLMLKFTSTKGVKITIGNFILDKKKQEITKFQSVKNIKDYKIKDFNIGINNKQTFRYYFTHKLNFITFLVVVGFSAGAYVIELWLQKKPKKDNKENKPIKQNTT